ncbi:helix-turn-helix domain-containing protein [Sansalvadorimonas sp. 2012CJ34-2]|uniref:Helix-turn-helix domain-containing protein n=1 Tax=Parendozoicomonas callyspongiae TaxID=2942213 RepID=A0ABT0PEJ3_9GAMM|nr:helix-turn-helix domain-containing protein [Sansalvadorimonas sp. 2012CJ34-2]MCL6269676.1 helix-turn-helix domain-containing protein [Sansalvadorimonas sp. 2012CJ34-2]
MGYKQLTEKDRVLIWSLRRERKSQAEIARILGCHRSTIGRELKRNSSLSGYDAHYAQIQASERKRHQGVESAEDYQGLINMLKNMNWSPEKQKEFLLRHHPEHQKMISKLMETKSKPE